ncbi:MAG: glycosyltransferase family 9 protein, partial [Patescibacteria group bacterium]
QGDEQRKGNSDFSVFLVASFYPIHGVEHVVRAAKILEKYPDIKFLIVGDGMTRSISENLAKELGSKNLTFRGIVTPEILAGLMVSADICLGQFGNTEHAEMVVPAKVYDAAAMAKPIITGGGRAVKSVFTDNSNALFCEFGNPADLAQKILLLKKNAALRKKIAQNVHSLFKIEFSLIKTGENLSHIILKMINGEFGPSMFQKTQLFIVRKNIKWQNTVLKILNKILFKSFPFVPKKILIYKVGNIGDTVCAVPSFIAIRRFYPNAKITLLSSPGGFGAVGAKEFFEGAWYFDDLKIYFSEDTDSFAGKKKLIKELKKESNDLFIQLPDDLAGFGTLSRNMIFAKLIGVKSALGFKVRTVQFFKKTQVDYAGQKYEAESLLDLLRENRISVPKIEYDFNISESHKRKVADLLKNKWVNLKKNDLVVVINPGGKREANRWPSEKFGEIGKYLQEKYGAKIIIIGGKVDLPRAEIIQRFLDPTETLVLAAQLELLEIIELLKRSGFLVSNDTGAVHMAVAINLPFVGLYGVRNVFGRWIPQGKNQEIIYHKFLNCDYRTEECIKKSIEAITVDEVKIACDRIIKR